MTPQKLLLSGATILISALVSILGNLGCDWIKDVNRDRSEQAKILVQLQTRSEYLYGHLAAAPVSTPSPDLKALAAAAK